MTKLKGTIKVNNLTKESNASRDRDYAFVFSEDIQDWMTSPNRRQNDKRHKKSERIRRLKQSD
jgi:hypothetical protein